MSFSVKILPEAKIDIQDAISWYNHKKAGLGKFFYADLKSRIAYIRRNPLHYQFNYKSVRSASLARFPFQVHYVFEEEKKQIVIFAIVHTSRNPDVWQSKNR